MITSQGLAFGPSAQGGGARFFENTQYVLVFVVTNEITLPGLGWLGVHRPVCPYMVSCKSGNGRDACVRAVRLQSTPVALSSYIAPRDCSTTISSPYTSCTTHPIRPIWP